MEPASVVGSCKYVSKPCVDCNTSVLGMTKVLSGVVGWTPASAPASVIVPDVNNTVSALVIDVLSAVVDVDAGNTIVSAFNVESSRSPV